MPVASGSSELLLDEPERDQISLPQMLPHDLGSPGSAVTNRLSSDAGGAVSLVSPAGWQGNVKDQRAAATWF